MQPARVPGPAGSPEEARDAHSRSRPVSGRAAALSVGSPWFSSRPWLTIRLGPTVEQELGNLRRKGAPVLPLEAVGAFHTSLRALENTKALVLVHPTRGHHRLLPHHALSLHLLILAISDGVVDPPDPVGELGSHRAHVLDPDRVGEHVVPPLRPRLLGDEAGANRDPNAVRNSMIECHRAGE